MWLATFFCNEKYIFSICYACKGRLNVSTDTSCCCHSIRLENSKRLAAGGRLVSLVQSPFQTQAESHGDTATFNAKFPIPEDLRKIVELVANGTIKTAIDRIYPLSEAAEAKRETTRSWTNFA